MVDRSRTPNKPGASGTGKKAIPIEKQAKWLFSGMIQGAFYALAILFWANVFQGHWIVWLGAVPSITLIFIFGCAVGTRIGMRASDSVWRNRMEMRITTLFPSEEAPKVIYLKASRGTRLSRFLDRIGVS